MSKVYLIITTCIKNNVGITWSDKRKQEYYLAIANALNLCPNEITPIIVENSIENNKSYLDVFKCDILYTNDNSRLIEGDRLYHKGHRELIDINKVIDKYDIQPNDLIIKLTGRYLLFQNDFFTTILANPDKDCFFRQYNVCTYEKDDISIVLGLFALRCKYFKVFEYKNHDVGAEEDFRTMINNYVDPSKIVKVERLWLRVFLGETGKMLDV
jgi:hypothetical protein